MSGDKKHHQSLDRSASCPLSWGPDHVQWTWQYQVQDPFRTSLFSSLGGPGSLLDLLCGLKRMLPFSCNEMCFLWSRKKLGGSTGWRAPTLTAHVLTAGKG